MMDSNTQSSLDISKAAQLAQTLRSEIGKAIVGQSSVVEQTLVTLLAGGHALIEGAPGLGKTLLVQAVAKTFNGEFARIQFTPDLMPSDVSGHPLYDMQSGQFQVRKGPVFTSIVLEIFKLSGLLISEGDEMSREFGLTSARWKIMGAIQLAGSPQTVPQIARSMGLTRKRVRFRSTVRSSVSS